MSARRAILAGVLAAMLAGCPCKPDPVEPTPPVADPKAEPQQLNIMRVAPTLGAEPPRTVGAEAPTTVGAEAPASLPATSGDAPGTINAEPAGGAASPATPKPPKPPKPRPPRKPRPSPPTTTAPPQATP